MFEVFALNVDSEVVYKQGWLLETDFIMLFIFRLNNIGERMLPCGTPFS